MSIFGLIAQLRCGGYIAGYGLKKWWFSSFTQAERTLIRKTISKPMSSFNHLDSGSKTVWMHYSEQGNKIEPVAKFLCSLCSWFTSAELRSIGRRIAEEGERQLKTISGADYHYASHNLVQFWFSARNDWPDSLEKLELVCGRQISVSVEARNELRAENKRLKQPIYVPSNEGYNQLCRLLFNQGRFAELEQIATLAKKEKWCGKWDEWIAASQGTPSKIRKSK